MQSQLCLPILPFAVSCHVSLSGSKYLAQSGHVQDPDTSWPPRIYASVNRSSSRDKDVGALKPIETIYIGRVIIVNERKDSVLLSSSVPEERLEPVPFQHVRGTMVFSIGDYRGILPRNAERLKVEIRPRARALPFLPTSSRSPQLAHLLLLISHVDGEGPYCTDQDLQAFMDGSIGQVIASPSERKTLSVLLEITTAEFISFCVSYSVSVYAQGPFAISGHVREIHQQLMKSLEGSKRNGASNNRTYYYVSLCQPELNLYTYMHLDPSFAQQPMHPACACPWAIKQPNLAICKEREGYSFPRSDW